MLSIIEKAYGNLPFINKYLGDSYNKNIEIINENSPGIADQNRIALQFPELMLSQYK